MIAIEAEGIGKQFRKGIERRGRLIEWLRGGESYERFWALQEVSFQVGQGEMLGIIGPNGAGKSTLLRIISRITRPTTGRAAVYGRVGSLLDVGTGFHPELTGRENIYLNGTVLGIPRSLIQDRFDEIVDFSGVEEFIDTPLKHYSAGMKVRLGVSVALNLPQEVMLVDEVLAVGDAAFREKCLDRIGEVTESGRAVMFVGHNMELISASCDRVIWLDKGRIRETGPAAAVVERYRQTAVTGSGRPTGFLNLEGRSDHGETDEIQLTHVRLLNGDGQQIPCFQTAQNVALAVGYRLPPGPLPEHVSVGLTLSSQGRVAVTHFENSSVGVPFDRLPHTGELVCEVDRLPITAGRYSLALKVRIGSRVIRNIPYGGSFQVIEGDFFETGVLPPPGTGNALVDHRWAVRPWSG